MLWKWASEKSLCLTGSDFVKSGKTRAQTSSPNTSIFINFISQSCASSFCLVRIPEQPNLNFSHTKVLQVAHEHLRSFLSDVHWSLGFEPEFIYSCTSCYITLPNSPAICFNQEGNFFMPFLSKRRSKIAIIADELIRVKAYLSFFHASFRYERQVKIYISSVDRLYLSVCMACSTWQIRLAICKINSTIEKFWGTNYLRERKE